MSQEGTGKWLNFTGKCTGTTYTNQLHTGRTDSFWTCNVVIWRLRSHWPPSWSGSRARWHWPGWQTVGADARCSAAGRVPQSEPGRAEAPAAWPTAGGRVTENPHVLIHIKVILMKRGLKSKKDRGHCILFLFFYNDDEPILYVLKIKINSLSSIWLFRKKGFAHFLNIKTKLLCH